MSSPERCWAPRACQMVRERPAGRRQTRTEPPGRVGRGRRHRDRAPDIGPYRAPHNPELRWPQRCHQTPDRGAQFAHPRPVVARPGTGEVCGVDTTQPRRIITSIGLGSIPSLAIRLTVSNRRLACWVRLGRWRPSSGEAGVFSGAAVGPPRSRRNEVALPGAEWGLVGVLLRAHGQSALRQGPRRKSRSLIRSHLLHDVLGSAGLACVPAIAGLAQLVEHLICNHEVASSILAPGSSQMPRVGLRLCASGTASACRDWLGACPAMPDLC